MKKTRIVVIEQERVVAKRGALVFKTVVGAHGGGKYEHTHIGTPEDGPMLDKVVSDLADCLADHDARGEEYMTIKGYEGQVGDVKAKSLGAIIRILGPKKWVAHTAWEETLPDGSVITREQEWEAEHPADLPPVDDLYEHVKAQTRETARVFKEATAAANFEPSAADAKLERWTRSCSEVAKKMLEDAAAAAAEEAPSK